MMDVAAYRDEHMPITLSDNLLEILNKGILYIHGRDKCFRPIMIFKTSVLTECLSSNLT